ncbi:MAG: hypothetical protein KC486_29180, partial [Myxococcales bacterium]|nr:hypothetical protein [Myxococcales bacterium]
PEGALEGLPAWVRVLVQAAAGDVAGLAASIREAASDGPLAIIEGLALAQLHCVDAAYERLEAGLRHVAPHERAHHYVPLARLAAAKGDDAQAARLLMAALQARADDARLMTRITGELLRLGDFGRTAALLRARAEREPPDPAVLEDLAALESWCGRLDEARAWATRALELEPDRVGPRRVLAICDALSGAPARALEALLAIDAPGDAETKTWIAELLAEQGERARAMDYLGLAAAQSRSVAHALIQLLVDRALVHPERVGYAESLGLRAPTSTDDLLDQVRGRLRTLHGNRTTTLTRMPSPAPGGPELLTLVRAGAQDVRKVSRNAAAELLKAVRHRAPDDLHRAFAALTERFPASPHPWCYWGELHLWLGELVAAEACFRRPVARDARWAYVGRAAIHLLRGEFAEAHAEFDAVSREYRPLPGATTHVYAGELYRRQGELTRAVAELDVAVEAKPGRVGARINRVLCNAALGQIDAAEREARDLQERYPWIFLSAARTIDAPGPTPIERLVALMEAALRSMRGNRSSHTITFFDARGRLRTLEDAATWRAFADERRTIVAQEIERRLMA